MEVLCDRIFEDLEGLSKLRLWFFIWNWDVGVEECVSLNCMICDFWLVGCPGVRCCVKPLSGLLNVIYRF